MNSTVTYTNMKSHTATTFSLRINEFNLIITIDNILYPQNLRRRMQLLQWKIMKIICMGDSITYGFGLSDLNMRWSNLVSQRTGHTLVNCGVSGDTSTGMLARCQRQVFGQQADALIFLGGINDISILGKNHSVYANVISIVRQAQAEAIPVILGAPLPVVSEVLSAPIWDPDRDSEELAQLCGKYADWMHLYAQANQLPMIDFRTPFLLPDGRVNSFLFQDGVHPTEEGHRLMADAACQTLEKLF